jgi:hypothetical protein
MGMGGIALVRRKVAGSMSTVYAPIVHVPPMDPNKIMKCFCSKSRDYLIVAHGQLTTATNPHSIWQDHAGVRAPSR